MAGTNDWILKLQIQCLSLIPSFWEEGMATTFTPVWDGLSRVGIADLMKMVAVWRIVPYNTLKVGA